MTKKVPQVAIEIARLFLEFEISRQKRRQAEAEVQPEAQPVTLDDLFVIVGLDKNPPPHLRRRSRRKR